MKSRPRKIKKRGKVQNMSEKIDLVIIGKKMKKRRETVKLCRRASTLSKGTKNEKKSKGRPPICRRKLNFDD